VSKFSESDNGGSTGAFFLGLFAGAAIGAGLGLMLAPKSGRETREQLSDSARSFGKTVSKSVDDLAERGRGAVDKAREMASNAGDQLDRVTADATKTIERGRRAVQAVADAVERS
jgi:gas vesicle protein